MEYFGHRIRLLEEMISDYNGVGPFHLYLKQFFKKHPECGSKDRRALRELAYVYWRIGCLISGDSLEAKLKKAIELLAVPIESYIPEYSATLLKNAGANLNIEGLRRFEDLRSAEITEEDWLFSRVKEPKLWLRVRGEIDPVREFFIANGIEFSEPLTGCFGILNGIDLKDMPKNMFKRIEVQDIASQKASRLIEVENGACVWDCCAGSGGKSLALLDRGVEMDLYVTDKRQPMLHNLYQRFRSAGYTSYAYKAWDLTRSAPEEFIKGKEKIRISTECFDHIICDVPCSGSGTWGRTPENWTTFDPKEVSRYAELQKSILEQVWPYVKSGGSVWYLTCSVFESENSELLSSFQAVHSDCSKEFDTYCNELPHGGDCLYFARLIKRL